VYGWVGAHLLYIDTNMRSLSVPLHEHVKPSVPLYEHVKKSYKKYSVNLYMNMCSLSVP